MGLTDAQIARFQADGFLVLPGLFDGYTDFSQPEAEPAGDAASMDLALATGRGSDILTNLEGRRPLVCDEDAVAFGFRDTDQSCPVPGGRACLRR